MHDESKELGHDDISGFEFAKEMLDGDKTAGINFDRIQKHPDYGYIIFEYLLCEETQTVTPYTSHPNRYWYKNKRKFLRLWELAQLIGAKLYLVNYAKPDTRAADEILLIEVKGVDANGITDEIPTKYTRKTFQSWFRKLNAECLGTESSDEEYKCPHCKSKINYGKYGYFCSSKCGMGISKLFGKTIPDELVEQLLSGQEVEFQEEILLPEWEEYSFVDKETKETIIRYRWKTS